MLCLSIRLRRLGSGAFTLVEVMVVVMILGVLMAIAIPCYVRQRAAAQADACINNLLKIDDAACQFALEHGKKTGDLLNLTQDLTPFIRLNAVGQIPPCPAGGSYILALVGAHPVCSVGSSVSPAHLLP